MADWGQDDPVVSQPQSQDWGADDPIAAPPDAVAQGEKRNWSDVPLEAAKNAPHSALEFGKNIVRPLNDVAEAGARGIDWVAQKLGATPRQAQPMETVESLGQLGGGVLQKLGLMQGDEYKPHADAVGKFLVDRYGSVEGVKKTLATDPVGMAADVSMLLTGGGSIAARAPGLVGRAGEVAATAGRAVDPLTAPLAAARGVGHLGAEIIGGIGTHTGGEALVQAARAGAEGGERAHAFRENISGVAPTEDVVRDAQHVLDGLRAQRGAEYRASMAGLGERAEVLDFDRIDRALAASTRVQTFHGQVLDPRSQAIRQEIGQAVQEWRMLPPEVFHTPEGLDALKKRIGNIRDQTQYGTPDRVIANGAYTAIGRTIREAAPEYAGIMDGYANATRQLGILQRELSIPTPDRGNIDTALRKMQSALRNNVNANFGRRRELAEFLVNNGAPHLMARLAGQALQPALPRGLGKLAMAIGTEMTAVGALATGAGLGAAAKALPAAALMSPRAMGEAAYWGGVGARHLRPVRRMAVPAAELGQVTDAAGFKAGGRVTHSFRYKP